MTAVPTALPGLVPLPGAQTLPGTMPTPHDPSADPFLALLSQLVAPAPAEAAGEAPVGAPAGAPVESEVPSGVAPEGPAGVPVPVLTEVPVEGGTDEEPETEETPSDTAEPAALPPWPALPALPPTVQPAVAPRPQAGTPVSQQQAGAVDTGAVDTDAPAPARTAPAPPLAPAAQAAPAPASPMVPAAVDPLAPLTHQAGRGEAPAPVARQVFPEVVRAAVTGVTPNRVVVRLQPEHLGEVRVVLRTDRSGSLEVTLAGGPEARAAIREGAPELRRLLEAAGTHDARVLVRHLTEPATTGTAVAATTATAATTTPTTTARTDVPTTAGGLPVDVGAGTAGGTAHGTPSQGEGRRGRTPQDARPGAMDGIPDRAVEATHPAGRRAGGLDVMM